MAKKDSRNYSWSDFMASYRNYEKCDGGWSIELLHEGVLDVFRVEDGYYALKGRMYPIRKTPKRGVPSSFALILRNETGEVFELIMNRGAGICLERRP